MLTQLKNCDWANLADVTMVEVCASYQYRDRDVLVLLPPRVAVTFRTGYIKMIHCESIEDARTYRDELAVMVNTVKAANDMPRWCLPNTKGMDAVTEDVRRAMKSSREVPMEDVPSKSWHDEKSLI